jgi:hypothetical protein
LYDLENNKITCFDEIGSDKQTSLNQVEASLLEEDELVQKGMAAGTQRATTARSKKRIGIEQLTWGDRLVGEGRRAVAATGRVRGGGGHRCGRGGPVR